MQLAKLTGSQRNSARADVVSRKSAAAQALEAERDALRVEVRSPRSPADCGITYGKLSGNCTYQIPTSRVLPNFEDPLLAVSTPIFTGKALGY